MLARVSTDAQGPTVGTRSLTRTLSASLTLGLVVTGCTPVPQDPTPSVWPDPDPARPVVELDYVVDEDLDQVVGTEHVTFVPDLEVCEVVLRAWPNKPMTADPGNALTVERVSVDGKDLALDVVAAGAADGAPGTLVEADLPTCVEAGTQIALDVDFALTLAEGTDERMGVDGDLGVAWLGTAYPVLAWEPGVGWDRGEAVPVLGETAMSATFDLARLSVTAPDELEVAGVGVRTGRTETPEGSATTTFAAPAMRDVAVTLGAVEIHDTEFDGVAVHLVTPEGMPAAQVEEWTTVVAGSLRATVDLLGPYPYDALWVSLLPVSHGIEQTGAVQIGLGDPEEQRWVVVHELAHQWFYGLVGNHQGRDPWLDESWASLVQEIVLPTGKSPTTAEVDGALGRSMEDWAQTAHPERAYVDTVYTFGARTLLELRREVGPQVWDAAVRDYLHDNAHRVARPDDLRTALADLPGVDETLSEAGAWG